MLLFSFQAAFLVRLVEPNVVTASVRTSLKSISGNASGMQLAARNCFLLEDPIDEKRKSADSQRFVSLFVAYFTNGLYILISDVEHKIMQSCG